MFTRLSLATLEFGLKVDVKIMLKTGYSSFSRRPGENWMSLFALTFHCVSVVSLRLEA